MSNERKILNFTVSEWLLFILTVSIIGGITLFAFEMHEQNMIAKAKFYYELSKDFGKDSISSGIFEDMSTGKKLLTKNGGRWSEEKVYGCLNFFEDLDDYIESGALNERDVYGCYGYYIIQSYNNAEIKELIKNFRAEEKDDAYYEAFEDIAKRFIKYNGEK
jgi:hypothetical protein